MINHQTGIKTENTCLITIKKYEKTDKEIWNEFIKKSKNGTFMLNRDFMDYHSDRFVDFSLMFYEENKLIALLPLSLHEKEVVSHGGLTYGGIISDFSMKQSKMIECFSVMKDYLKSNGIQKLIYKKIPYIYFDSCCDEDLYALFLNEAKLIKKEASCAINLANPIKMSKGRKAQISRAKREGVEIVKSLDFDTFINLENKVLNERHNTSAVHSALELELLKSRFNEEIELYCAMYKDEMIAGCVLFVYENIVHTQYLAANEVSRKIGALDLLIKFLMDKYDSKKYFDFGISTENCGKYLNEGLMSQKESFGARTFCYETYEICL